MAVSPTIFKIPFGGVNTDIAPTKLKSGTADVALNVTVQQGRLAKRDGFGVFNQDVTGAGTGILNIFPARFDDGSVRLMVKCSDATHGRVYFCDVTTTSTFTGMPNGQAHSVSDPGWWFMHSNRMYYFDTSGGSKWNPTLNSGNAWKAGIAAPTVGALATPAGGGGKDGAYHIQVAAHNSVTLEESVCSGPQSPPISCSTPLLGGIAVSNWSSVVAGIDSSYEFDYIAVYCTHATEAAGGVEVFTYRAYLDVLTPKTAASCGLNKSDACHDPRSEMTNAGGVPPGASIGCLHNGNQAIYGIIISGSAVLYDRIEFSLPGFPTMVPQPMTYSAGNDSTTFYPRPWTGQIQGGFQGQPTALANGAGTTVLFTPAATYSILSDGYGKVYTKLLHAGKGNCARLGAVGTSSGVFGLGYNCLLRVQGDRAMDLAENRFSELLADIPDAYRTVACAGWYSHENQVWFAVAKSGGTLAKRIIVLDLTHDAVTVFEPAGLASGEGITCMCELAYGLKVPVMMLGTNTGRVLQYPVGSVDVLTTVTTPGGVRTYANSNVNYATDYRFYIGNERAAISQRLSALDFRLGENTAGNVSVAVTTLRAPDEANATPCDPITFSKSLKREVQALDITAVDGRYFQVEIASDNTVATAWTIEDLYATLISQD